MESSFKAAKDRVSPVRLRELLSYNPETGLLFWLESRGRVKKGDIAGYNQNGYIYIRVDDVIMAAHRVGWAIHTGNHAELEIDHIDGNRRNNKWANLRTCSRAINARNMKLLPSNTSGVCGVVWDKSRGKWAAHIKVDQKMINLGRFVDKIDAIKARRAAEPVYGFTSRHGTDH